MKRFLNIYSKRIFAIIMSFLVLTVCTTTSVFGLAKIDKVEFKTEIFSTDIPFKRVSWTGFDKSLVDPYYPDVENVMFSDSNTGLQVDSNYMYDIKEGKWIDPETNIPLTTPPPTKEEYMNCKFICYYYAIYYDESRAELSSSFNVYLDGKLLPLGHRMDYFTGASPSIGSTCGRPPDGTYINLYNIYTKEDFESAAASFTPTIASSTTGTSKTLASPATGDDNKWLCLGLSLIVSLGAFGLVLRRQESER